MKIRIRGPFIKRGQVLKAARLVDMGSDAKDVIQGGQVNVNRETEVRRGRKLYPGDRVEYDGITVELT